MSLFKRVPTCSLCHTTARLPDGWREAARAWLDNCDHPEFVEHVLTTDEPIDVQPIFQNTVVGVNEGPKTAVAGWNCAVRLSKGKFIISLADDWFPCPHWDTELLKVIPDLDGEYALDVNTGGNHHLLTFSLLTRAYLEGRLNLGGDLFYPEYTGMYADNDFTDQARLDKVIVNARHLLFEHKHPAHNPEIKADKIHLWQGRPEAYRIGLRVYKARCAQKGLRIRPKIAICLPGDHFSATWVAYWTTLMNDLSKQYDMVPIFGYSSNVYATRACMAYQVTTATMPEPDFVLWIDDDNLLTYAHFQQLANSLDSNQQADAVAAWCWIQPDVYGIDAKISAGKFGKDGSCVPLTYREMMDSPKDMIEVDYTGFPVVLMRYSLIHKAGESPFAPILSPGHVWGFSGEDVAFCMNAKRRGGARLFVDRRVRVPHLKLRDAEPSDLPPMPESVSKNQEEVQVQQTSALVVA